VDNSAAEPGAFSWLGEAFAGLAVGVTLLLAWIQDRLTINRKIAVLETKMDLLLAIQTQKET